MSEVRPVEEIEELRPELQLGSLTNLRGFHQRRIDAGKTRTNHSVTREVAVEAIGRKHESVHVIVAIRPSQHGIVLGTGSKIGTISLGGTVGLIVRYVISSGYVDGQSSRNR